MRLARTDSSIHPCSRIRRMDVSWRREVRTLLLFATTAESRHVTTRDNDSPKSTPLCNCHLALTPPVDNLLLFATTTGARHVFTRVRLGTHPCSRTRRLDVLDVLDGAKATRVGRVRLFAIFSSLFCLQTTARDSCVTRRPTRTHPCSRIGTMAHSLLAQQHRQAEEYASLRHPFALFAGTDQPAALRAKGRLACPSTRRRCRARGTLVGGQGLGLEGIWYRIR